MHHVVGMRDVFGRRRGREGMEWDVVEILGSNSIENIGLSFGLKNHFSFGLRFPILRKSSKMGSLDMSKNQNGISINFF